MSLKSQVISGTAVVLVVLCTSLLVSFPLVSRDKTQDYAYQCAQRGVKQARESSDKNLAQLFDRAGLNYPPEELFMRVHKYEGELELWARNTKQEKYQLLKTYDVCAMSGTLGPKRQQGDGQVPEGVYHLSLFNPHSSYHLSLQVNYPNRADRILTTNPAAPGNLIFVHGACASIGCVAIENGPIEELYWAALQTQAEERKRIPIHILPFKMDHLRADLLMHLEQDETKRDLWSQLYAIDRAFHSSGRIPLVEIDREGKYRLKGEGV